MHIRSQIRQQIAINLTEAAIVVKGRVYESISHPHQTHELPALEVHAPVDMILGQLSQAPKIYRRELTVIVNCIAKGKSAEDEVNSMADQVEAKLLPDHSLNGLAEDVDLEKTEITIDGRGAECHVEAEMLFSIRYITQHPYIVDEEFNELHADWDMAQADGQIDASDHITPEQENL